VPEDLLQGLGRNLAIGKRGAQPVPECVKANIMRRQAEFP
jgi:hypothetical protein